MYAQGGDEYISVLTEAVSGCKAFVLICSTTYGSTQFTKAEFNLANSEKKVCITQGLMREAFLWYSVSPAHSSPPPTVRSSSRCCTVGRTRQARSR
jgi:hypothetical protein